MVNKLSWLNEVVVKPCLEDKPWPVDEINIDGSWECGKTYGCIETVCKSLTGNKVGAVFVRRSNFQIGELENSVYDLFKVLNISWVPQKDNSSFTTIKVIPSENICRFVYAERKRKVDNEAKFSGLRQFINYKKVIIFVDEAFEISEDDRKTLIGKVRGNSDTEVLIIQCCNPYLLSNDYVKYVAKNLPFNKHKLMNYGYDMSSVEFVKKHRKIFVHMNVISTPEIMNEKKWKRINEACARSRDRAITIKFGIPSYDKMSEYGSWIEKIPAPYYRQKVDKIVCGVDVGGGTNRNAGITSCFVGFYTKGVGVDFFREYTQDNKILEKSITVRANEIINFVLEELMNYRRKIGSILPLPFVNINVDLSNYDFISRLNEVINERCLTSRMRARRNRKNDFQIMERVNYTKDWIENRKLRIDFNNCPILKEEMSSMKLIYSNEALEPTKRESANDHCINGLEYAMEDIWEIEQMKDNSGIIVR